MLRRRLRLAPILLLVLPLLAACEGGPPWRSGDGGDDAAERDDFGPTAAYDRRLIFLGPGEALPTGAVFDFAALSDSTALRRGIRARLVDGSEWVPLIDAGWEMEPMRDPWRLVPYGDLKVVVGDAGDLDALIVRGEVEVRLEPGPTIAEYSPDAGTQLVLRQGRLRLGEEAVPGILLDAQLARAIPPVGAPTIPDGEATPNGGAPRDSAAADTAADTTAVDTAQDPAAEADSGGRNPAPAPRPGAEALLLDNSGYYVVFAASADGEIAWLHTGGRDDVRRGARLEPTEWEAFPEGNVRVPTAWRISAPGEGLTGELRAEAADRAMLNGPGEPAALGYVVVSGYVEDRGVRRNVYGLVRHVR